MTSQVRIGLISDTHMPQRLREIPPAVFDVFADVDLILHAGDVGELYVLDQLATCAPVIAVHGNDDTEAATNALPYLQTIAAGGHRLVLTHAHYPDRAQEIASRVDQWEPILARRSGFARTHGADICIFGHTHIPMLITHDDVLLINPGAMASGNPWQRQLIQTVAILTLTPDTAPQVDFVNLSEPDVPYTPYLDLPGGFMGMGRHYEAPIVAPELHKHMRWLWQNLLTRHPDYFDYYMGLAFDCWDGKREVIHTTDVVDLYRDDPEAIAILHQNPFFASHFT